MMTNSPLWSFALVGMLTLDACGSSTRTGGNGMGGTGGSATGGTGGGSTSDSPTGGAAGGGTGGSAIDGTGELQPAAQARAARCMLEAAPASTEVR